MKSTLIGVEEKNVKMLSFSFDLVRNKRVIGPIKRLNFPQFQIINAKRIRP